MKRPVQKEKVNEDVEEVSEADIRRMEEWLTYAREKTEEKRKKDGSSS